MDQIETVVIGAGVIGLAVARALANAGHDLLLLEAMGDFGTETSARSSEVIHAGIYYPPRSLKARLCVAGRQSFYEFCKLHGVPYRNCGKLIVATSRAQLIDLQKIKATAETSGVELAFLDEKQALELEPNLSCFGALHSPATGIVDSRAYMLALLGQTEDAGAAIAYRTRVTRGWVDRDGIRLAVNDEREPTIHARNVINCAGLYAPHIAAAINGLPKTSVPKAYFAKGNYFALLGRAPFSRLVYPVPESGGLGVHLTLDLGGGARFGPDVEWIDQLGEPIDYRVNPLRGENFYPEIRKYWPKLVDGALVPAYAGMRPKISGPNETAMDFRIDGPSDHGVPGIVNLFGIESPGLTASLAIGDEVLLRIS